MNLATIDQTKLIKSQSLKSPKKMTLQRLTLAKTPSLGKTCILAHAYDSPTLNQHWCNFGGLTLDGGVLLWWNDPHDPRRVVTPAQFKSMYRIGSFNHAHEVGVGSVRKPSWWERLWCWFTVKI
jgi:hypothetical protein